MAFRTVSLSEDAYDRLASMRKPGESFSDVVRRLTRGRSITELSGLWTKAEAESVSKAMAEARKAKRLKKRERLGGP